MMMSWRRSWRLQYLVMFATTALVCQRTPAGPRLRLRGLVAQIVIMYRYAADYPLPPPPPRREMRTDGGRRWGKASLPRNRSLADTVSWLVDLVCRNLEDLMANHPPATTM